MIDSKKLQQKRKTREANHHLQEVSSPPNLRNRAATTYLSMEKSMSSRSNGKLSLKGCLSVGSKGPQKADTIATMGINDNRVEDDANYYNQFNNAPVTPRI